MAGYGYRRQAPQAARAALVSPAQARALDRMAEANGFANGSALLADVASCTVAELGRKSRPVVQMFIGQAFARYGRTSARPVWCEFAAHGTELHTPSDECLYPHEAGPAGATPRVGHPLTSAD